MGLKLKKVLKAVAKPFTLPVELGGQYLKDIKDHNEHVANRQYQKELEAWNLQNEYNTPANQVQRLRDAGLNPNLFYSQGDTGNAAAAPAVPEVDTKGQLFGYAFQALQFLTSIQQMQFKENMANAQLAHSKDVLDFNRKRAAMEFFQEQERLDYERGEIGKYGAKPGSMLYFFSKLFSNFVGKNTTDVATDAGRYASDLMKLMLYPIEASGNLRGYIKAHNHYNYGIYDRY